MPDVIHARSGIQGRFSVQLMPDLEHAGNTMDHNIVGGGGSVLPATQQAPCYTTCNKHAPQDLACEIAWCLLCSWQH